MVQEIITYMIIGSAFTLAILKFWKRFWKKKPANVKQNNSGTMHAHDCNACSAECQLRDLPRMVIEKNIDECVQVEKKSKLLQS